MLFRSITFDWTLLDKYPSQKPYFLSGGIGIESVDDIKQFKKSHASKYCYALDINSQFEDAPGQKNIEKLHAEINVFLGDISSILDARRDEELRKEGCVANNLSI